jgi:uncharacterized protein YegL
MNELEEIKVQAPEEPKCALVLSVDVSGSMSEIIDGLPKIQELNEGLKLLKEELAKDSLAIKRVKISLVTFRVRITDGSSRGVGEN